MQYLIRIVCRVAIALAVATMPTVGMRAYAQPTSKAATPARSAPPSVAKPFANAAWQDRSLRSPSASSKSISAVRARTAPPPPALKPDFKNLKVVTQKVRPNAGGHALTLRERGLNLAKKVGGNSMTYKTSPNRGANINLAGASHAGIATPHIHERRFHTSPDGKGASWKRNATPRRATGADMRLAERVARRTTRPR